jgi:ankyrin repeat protein
MGELHRMAKRLAFWPSPRRRIDAAVRRLPAFCLVVVLAAVSLGAGGNDQRLVDAVRRQDKEGLQSLLAQGADVNIPQPDGATALHWATYWDDLDTTERLIRAGADANAANDYGVRPLALACANGGASLIEKLLSAQADPNAASSTGETPLMVCARTGNVDGIKALLARGAQPNLKEAWQQQTALMMAVGEGHLAAAKTLIDSGADVRAKSTNGFTPLLFAAREGTVEAARLLLEAGADINAAASDGSTPLLVATVRGHSTFASWALAHGADPNAAGPGFTPLHWVAGSWHSELTGPNGITAARDEEWVSLGGVPSREKLKLTEALLAHGADPSARLARNPPQFGFSSARFKVSMVGATPFLLAAMDGNTSLMRRLVAGGANPLLATAENTTPLMVAAGLGRVPAESPVTESDTMNAVRLALELGGDVHAVNKDGNTALHGAAHIRHDALIQFLVDRGAAVNVRNARGLTPLMVAEGSGHSDNPGIVGGSTGNLLRKLGGR